MIITHRKSVVSLGIGLCLACIGTTFYFCFPVIFNHLLKKEIALVNGTLGYKVWQDIPFPIYQKLYFFNITNSDGFMRRKEKPVLKEIGPYTFRSKWVKKALQWHPNGTVSYKEVRTFVFLRNQSVGSQNDQIVTLNGPLLMAANFLKDYELPIKLAASFLFGVAGERLIVKKSIKQLAFDGYRDIIVLLSPILKSDIPFKEGLFAWLYGKNDTDDGIYNVFTGADNLNNLNILNNWNGKDVLSFWNGKRCNMLNGTNAELGPPIRPDQNTYTFFQSIFCRSITLNYTENVQHSGIDSRRFMTTKMTFANATENPENACFTGTNVFPSGVQDISECQFGAPILLSFPHFYMADPWYTRMVDGLKPNATIHSFHLDVEPITGVSIDAGVKFQINMYLQRIQGIAQLQGLPKVVFPVFWADLTFSLPQDWVQIFRNRVLTPRFAVYAIIYAFIGIGVFTILGAIIVMFHIHWKQAKKILQPDTVFPTSK